MENEVLKAIKERRSIRRFKADQITDEELKTGIGGRYMGSYRSWHTGAFHHCRSESRDLRPASQDERRHHGCRERSILRSANHRHRPGSRK